MVTTEEEALPLVITPWEKTQALIIRDDLMQLYNDYEVVEIEWRKKERKDVQK